MEQVWMLNEEECWQAVVARDVSRREDFVLGVRSTRIYCRPGCPSRLPRRENVAFYNDGAEARAAGFRPCKRCKPDQELEPQAELAAAACRLIEERLEDGRQDLSLDALGRALHVSPWHLQRVFKAVTGLSPRRYAAGLREQRLAAALREGQEVSSAVYAAGYSSNSRAYENAARRLGMTPGRIRRGGLGMRITYALVDSPLGRLLVAATGQGVCAVALGEDDAELEAFLYSLYPQAEIAADAGRAAASLTAWVQQVIDYLGGQRTRLDLPLDLRAEAFQLRVWEALRSIPYGETRTYSEVASAIGQPKAIRAVANACAGNPAALVTPATV